jgi:hypothetical protein
MEVICIMTYKFVSDSAMSTVNPTTLDKKLRIPENGKGS